MTKKDTPVFMRTAKRTRPVQEVVGGHERLWQQPLGKVSSHSVTIRCSISDKT